MSQSHDVWFVRFPDGQVLRANSTEAVRHHLDSGRIPRDSWVRRSPDDEWVAVEWMPELTEEAPAAARRPASPRPQRVPDQVPSLERTPAPSRRTAPRDDRLRLHTIGARGMVEELTTALDSSLSRLKLRISYVSALLIALSCVALSLITPELERPWPLVVWLAAGLAFIVVASIGTSLITRATVAEMSHTGRGQWSEATRALPRTSSSLAILYLLVFGTTGLAVWVLSRAMAWLPLDWQPETREAIAGVAAVLLLVIGVLLGPLTLTAFQFAPILVIEECSAGKAFGLWWQAIVRHGRRLYLYEGLAAAVAVATALPLLVPLALLAPTFLAKELASPWPLIRGIVLAILAALAAARLFTYLIVANLSIYLNLRYEQVLRR
jgi:hypothetical protein